jgi:DNA polymerase-1
VLLSADYSQVELRVLAHIADEPVLKEIFARDEDVHTATASQVFQVQAHEIDPGMRSKAKMINYGIVYGLSDYGLADRLNIPR